MCGRVQTEKWDFCCLPYNGCCCALRQHDLFPDNCLLENFVSVFVMLLVRSSSLLITSDQLLERSKVLYEVLRIKKILNTVFYNAVYTYIQDWFLVVGKCVCGWTLNIDYWTFFRRLAATKQRDWFFEPASPIRENIFQRFWHIHKNKCTLRGGHNS